MNSPEADLVRESSPSPQTITILPSSDAILSGFIKSIAITRLFVMLHARNPPVPV